MADSGRNILICSCEGSMPLDAESARRGCRGSEVSTADQLCRAELAKFRDAVAADAPLTVGCTQESPLFDEIAAEIVGDGADIRYVNIRETAGWSRDAPLTAPKMQRCSQWRRCPHPKFPI